MSVGETIEAWELLNRLRLLVFASTQGKRWSVGCGVWDCWVYNAEQRDKVIDE